MSTRKGILCLLALVSWQASNAQSSPYFNFINRPYIADSYWGNKSNNKDNESNRFRNQGFQRGGVFFLAELFGGNAEDVFLSGSSYASIVPGAGFLDAGTQSDQFTNFYNHLDRELGYHLGIGYDFPSCEPCSYGFSLEYTHFDSKHFSETPITVSSLGFAIPTIQANYSSFVTDQRLAFLLGSAFTGFFSQADTSLKFDYNHVDLLGHSSSITCNKLVLFLVGGIRYVNLDEKVNANYRFVPTVGSPADLAIYHANDNVAVNSQFRGVGTNLGIASYYPLIGNLAFSVQSTALLVYGSSDNHYDESFAAELTGIQDSAPTVEYHTTSNTNHIVPGLTAKVSLAYAVPFCNCSSLLIEAGYRADKYFGMDNHIAFLNATTGQKAGGALNTNGYTDFDLSGPYVTLTYHL